jgi:hypothetical protein
MVVKTGMGVVVETDISRRTLTYDLGSRVKNNLIHMGLRPFPPFSLP